MSRREASIHHRHTRAERAFHLAMRPTFRRSRSGGFSLSSSGLPLWPEGHSYSTGDSEATAFRPWSPTLDRPTGLQARRGAAWPGVLDSMFDAPRTLYYPLVLCGHAQTSAGIHSRADFDKSFRGSGELGELRFPIQRPFACVFPSADWLQLALHM